ncbi:hypothetical protein HMPREF3293_01235 [Christensenella minuta]|uniref:Uncharacterized protein n=1 Tax=Christensenella minuta TaxID=626937 RepID=A0A136Q5J0_9FIRM|nr:hypothetical protein HMPREF3293_01235 [Christensenella minuta]
MAFRTKITFRMISFKKDCAENETLCPERGICKNSLRSMPLIMTCVYAIFNALGIK